MRTQVTSSKILQIFLLQALDLDAEMTSSQTGLLYLSLTSIPFYNNTEWPMACRSWSRASIPIVLYFALFSPRVPCIWSPGLKTCPVAPLWHSLPQHRSYLLPEHPHSSRAPVTSFFYLPVFYNMLYHLLLLYQELCFIWETMS